MSAALEPIAGISLEKYAELCALMKDTGTDLVAQVNIAATNGCDEASWNSAKDGWVARMSSAETAAEVAMAYMPLYQTALSKVSPTFKEVSVEEYAQMVHLANSGPEGIPQLYAKYEITGAEWSQISHDWIGKMNASSEFGDRYAAAYPKS